MKQALTHDDIAARLYLHAVLPAFEELACVSPRAQSLISDWNCAVEFALPGGDGAAVRFEAGAVSVLPQRCAEAAISLFFLSARQLVNQFEGRFCLPLPRRGLLKLVSLYRFQKLGTVLQQELEQHPRLLLGVALASLPPLIAHDPDAQKLMDDCPPGLAEFRIPGEKLFGWAEWKANQIRWGRGPAPQAADVVISFPKKETALAALRGELDEWAAIGTGELQVRGLAPLADALGLVMARADHYLERPKP